MSVNYYLCGCSFPLLLVCVKASCYKSFLLNHVPFVHQFLCCAKWLSTCHQLTSILRLTKNLSLYPNHNLFLQLSIWQQSYSLIRRALVIRCGFSTQNMATQFAQKEKMCICICLCQRGLYSTFQPFNGAVSRKPKLYRLLVFLKKKSYLIFA